VALEAGTGLLQPHLPVNFYTCVAVGLPVLNGMLRVLILAHAQDYGQWARNLASQVTALLTAKEGCTP